MDVPARFPAVSSPRRGRRRGMSHGIRAVIAGETRGHDAAFTRCGDVDDDGRARLGSSCGKEASCSTHTSIEVVRYPRRATCERQIIINPAAPRCLAPDFYLSLSRRSVSPSSLEFPRRPSNSPHPAGDAPIGQRASTQRTITCISARQGSEVDPSSSAACSLQHQHPCRHQRSRLVIAQLCTASATSHLAFGYVASAWRAPVSSRLIFTARKSSAGAINTRSPILAHHTSSAAAQHRSIIARRRISRLTQNPIATGHCPDRTYDSDRCVARTATTPKTTLPSNLQRHVGRANRGRAVI